MTERKNIFAIIGSASRNSANQKLVEKIAELAAGEFSMIIFDELKSLPHFDPDLSIDNTPQSVLDFREAVNKADGVLISTPEYIYSIPSGLKNAIEWCVSTTVFTDKPTGLITASASGKKGHEELQLIMKTVMASFSEETVLLINGVKGKVTNKGEIDDARTKEDLMKFIESFKSFIENASR